MADDQEREPELGALWIKQSKAGREFMTGKFGDEKVVAFRNTPKKNENEPDWRIYKSRPRE